MITLPFQILNKSKTCIVIPALNEENTIAAVVREACEFGTPVIVDDGSTDSTSKLAEENGGVILKNAISLGYESALSKGLQYAAENKFLWAVTIDADGQHSTSDIPVILLRLDEGKDIVTTIRNKLPRVSERLFGCIASLVWGIRDPLSGMKGYNLRNDCFKSSFDQDNYAGAALAIKIKINGGSHSSQRIMVQDREDIPRYGNAFAANYKILKALFTLLFLKKLNKET